MRILRAIPLTVLMAVVVGSIHPSTFMEDRIPKEQATSMIDVVSVLPDGLEEALYYYDNNWKHFRQEALQQGIIDGYQMHVAGPDSSGWHTILLITEFPDSASLASAELNFGHIMAAHTPNEAVLANRSRRSAFIGNRQGWDARIRLKVSR